MARYKPTAGWLWMVGGSAGERMTSRPRWRRERGRRGDRPGRGGGGRRRGAGFKAVLPRDGSAGRRAVSRNRDGFVPAAVELPLAEALETGPAGPTTPLPPGPASPRGDVSPPRTVETASSQPLMTRKCSPLFFGNESWLLFLCQLIGCFDFVCIRGLFVSARSNRLGR